MFGAVLGNPVLFLAIGMEGSDRVDDDLDASGCDRSEVIRSVENGEFAPKTMSQLLKGGPPPAAQNHLVAITTKQGRDPAAEHACTANDEDFH
ncbi:hypothetical protein CVT23_01790 [Minwuia thermotolerans]|uniref:Uncharacterized protein n=1 Tax=Minwuia thermotolerans TaxID=2056226 RepID=A0A2M9G6U5_9PROT|nr:hypothetical protein CVT23_01790 [Minwuia thermotolerans]